MTAKSLYIVLSAETDLPFARSIFAQYQKLTLEIRVVGIAYELHRCKWMTLPEPVSYGECLSSVSTTIQDTRLDYFNSTSATGLSRLLRCPP